MNRKQAVATNSERHANQVEGKSVTQSQLDINSKSILDYTATEIPSIDGFNQYMPGSSVGMSTVKITSDLESYLASLRSYLASNDFAASQLEDKENEDHSKSGQPPAPLQQSQKPRECRPYEQVRVKGSAANNNMSHRR
ncbi:hypothetical protein Asppvi_009100 [Aspergillus pseudoviridinutans]|uniref:Uncharacterized protein n=1 Tax=Aspergillus pseudoviridinutans TaxID=1517512 RepID=A0A9P3BJJ7_9EURO|nr:uncharacterized protein Asppvi_009100 [Aspergillus pseudoviridinutans]GIJ90148.1 hypothetical protein Asppvi_009100 [Aspergillus pseudoviridinutans]